VCEPRLARSRHFHTSQECPLCGVYCKNVWEIFSEEAPRGGRGLHQAVLVDKRGRRARREDEIPEPRRDLLDHEGHHRPEAFTRMSFNAGASEEEIQAAALLASNMGVSSAELSTPLIEEVAESL